MTEWFGWIWTGGAWQRVCEGASLAECSDRLSAECRRRGVQAKYSCLTGGGAPRFIPHDATQAIRSDGENSPLTAGECP